MSWSRLTHFTAPGTVNGLKRIPVFLNPSKLFFLNAFSKFRFTFPLVCGCSLRPFTLRGLARAALTNTAQWWRLESETCTRVTLKLHNQRLTDTLDFRPVFKGLDLDLRFGTEPSYLLMKLFLILFILVLPMHWCYRNLLPTLMLCNVL